VIELKKYMNLFVIVILFIAALLMVTTDTADAKWRYWWVGVMSPDGGDTLNTWAVVDATSSDTGNVYIDITGFDIDKIAICYKVLGAHADSAQCMIYVYQGNESPDSSTASAIESYYALTDSVDVDDTLYHCVTLSNLVPARFIILMVNGQTASDDTFNIEIDMMSQYDDPAWR
jgi:hypothetical protein